MREFFVFSQARFVIIEAGGCSGENHLSQFFQHPDVIIILIPKEFMLAVVYAEGEVKQDAEDGDEDRNEKIGYRLCRIPCVINDAEANENYEQDIEKDDNRRKSHV